MLKTMPAKLLVISGVLAFLFLHTPFPLVLALGFYCIIWLAERLYHLIIALAKVACFAYIAFLLFQSLSVSISGYASRLETPSNSPLSLSCYLKFPAVHTTRNTNGWTERPIVAESFSVVCRYLDPCRLLSEAHLDGMISPEVSRAIVRQALCLAQC